MYDVTAYGATGSGTANDTAAVAATLAAVPASGGEVYFPPGTYLCDTIAPKARTYIHGAGGGASILKQQSDTPAHHVIVPVSGAADITIDGLGFTGAGTTSGNTFGIFAGAVASAALSRIKVLNCHFTGFSGCGVALGQSTVNGGAICTDAMISGCTFTDNGVNLAQNSGVALINVNRVVIDGCIIQHSGVARSYAGSNSGIDMEPNAATDVIQNVIVSDCIIRNTGGGIQVKHGITSGATRSVAITGCQILECAVDAITIVSAQQVTMTGNNIHENGRCGVIVFTTIDAADCVVSGNTILDNNQAGSNAGQIVTYASGWVISGNRIGMTTAYGLAPAVEERTGANYNLIVGNNLKSAIPATVVLVGPNSKQLNNIS